MAGEDVAHFEVQDRDGGKVVCLHGTWDLFAQGYRLQRIAAKLKALDEPAGLEWDLTDVETMDSAGALVLWNLWGRRMPRSVKCRPEQRKWFERLGHLEIRRRAQPWSVWLWLNQLGMQVERFALGAWEMSLLVGRAIVDAIFLARHPKYIP